MKLKWQEERIEMLSKLLEYHGKDVRLSHNITRDENFKLFDA